MSDPESQANPTNDAAMANENAPQAVPPATKPTPKGKKAAPTLDPRFLTKVNAPYVSDTPDSAVMTSHGDLGTVTQPEHAVSLIKGKVTQLHTLIHNIGSVVEAPLLEMEALVAEMQFLFGVIRKRI